MRARTALLSFAIVAPASGPSAAQERIDADVYWKIRREATDRSEILRTLHVLTDRYGPRLTGSPNLRGAQDWVVRQATTWGLANARLEPWEFGHPGWLNERLAVHVVSPVKDALVVEALAWTPGTNGRVTAETTLIELPERPSKDRLTALLESVRHRVKGRAVMIGQPQKVALTIEPPDDDDSHYNEGR
jgi:carboxypeptidase Q